MSLKDPPLPLVHLEPIQHAWAHREWGWADEQSWIKSFIIPFADDWTRYASNPVFDKGSAGEWDDHEVNHPCVVRQGEKYHLFYVGRRLSGDWQIGYAYSTSPYGPFTRYASNPIISPTGAETRANMPSMIYDYYETDSAKKWKAWITHYSPYATKFYTAPNPGGPWTLQGTCTGLTNYKYGNSVNRVGLLYHIAYADTSSGISTATSMDGLNWVYACNILSHGAGGEWDDAADAYLSLFWNLGVWYLFYGGIAVGYAHFQIGMATNGDGWSTFTKFFHNPIYSYGTAGAWDEKHVYFPSLIMVEDKFYMYYAGCDNSNVYKIGLATIP